MMLDLPESFDANEWFLIISVVVIASFSLLLPKRFPFIVMLVLYTIGPTIAMNVDFLLGIPPIDVYNINDDGRYELFDLLFYFLYAPFSYLFIYFYDRLRFRGFGTALYVLGCSAAGAAYEWIAVLCHVFQYKGWNLGYSFIVYVSIQAIYLGLAHFFKRAYNASKRDTAKEWS
ncbi:hypothetical protein FHS18_002668 [Paenibacillus phyllosphaerae]|uniref:Uncharacterized protein n=1 Tax=Paenibacillus phyllosphaerae TaxID=274593 RepID=A0A7W5AYS5_9BACL|nr:hypothetical protein [Paenibacillus phyllosphaerae]MBB3110601.1 hypothetical protein [Paenibacillus phyllosphaerae]